MSRRRTARRWVSSRRPFRSRNCWRGQRQIQIGRVQLDRPRRSGLNMTFVKDTSPAKTIQDVFKREVILGATGRSSTVAVYPSVLASVIGAKFKMVLGYAGSTEAMLAMERGEVEGHSTSIEAVRALHPDLAEREEDHHPGAICAPAASGAAGRSDVVGARPQSRGAADPQARRQCGGGRKDDPGAARHPADRVTRCGGRSMRR